MNDEKFRAILMSVTNNSVDRLVLTVSEDQPEPVFLKNSLAFEAYRDQVLNMHQIMDLADALAKNESITYLDLSGQPMKDYHYANTLAIMLASNNKLEIIKLNSCKLGAVGLILIASGVNRCKSLQHLELRNNMPDGVRCETNLYDWRSAGDTSYSMESFINSLALGYNKTLTYLDLCNNKLAEMDSKIQECLNNNPESAITTLVLSDGNAIRKNTKKLKS